ncbi:MAG: response regulator transcription factor [Pseudonocardia sp.]|nr:response regulator transcription factor [Pseudonocardia sp.]
MTDRRPSQAPEPAPRDPDVPVLVVDDHELVATSIVMSLRAEGLSTHLGKGRGVAAILEEARALAPGLVLLDLDLGRDHEGNRVDGVELVAPLMAGGWQVLVLSGSADHARIGSALDAGALAWVPKHAPFPTLLSSVREAVAGRAVMSPERRQRFIDLYHQRDAESRELTDKIDRLTQREREVLAELARGRRAQAVADHFVVSLATVRTQIRAVLTKLEVGSQLEAVALYRRATRS